MTIGGILLSGFIMHRFRVNHRKKALRNLAKGEVIDFIAFAVFTFTDRIFARRIDETYTEEPWESYESYLITDEFILFIIKGLGLENANFVGKRQFRKEEYEELIAFLAFKFPVWKR